MKKLVMPAVTSFFLAGFGCYVGAALLGFIEPDIPLLYLLGCVVTGLYWLAERFVYLPRRKAAASAEANGLVSKSLLEQPWWLNWTAGLFGLLSVIFVFRSFLFEPVYVPSESMLPTLQVGDRLLINKLQYGLRLPVANIKLTQGSAVQRGDMVTFRYPPKPNITFIKRVVGLPGDEISYQNKKLVINGVPVPWSAMPDYRRYSELDSPALPQFSESLGAKPHALILNPEGSPGITPAQLFISVPGCQYSNEGFACTVPAGHYFMLGDNRDNSLDSRYWGFVPDANLLGKAVVIWLNLHAMSRIGFLE